MSSLFQGLVIPLSFVCLVHSPFLASRVAGALAALLRACSFHRLPARVRFAPSMLQRAVCAILIVVMSGQGALASPAIAGTVVDSVSAVAIDSGQRIDFWWH